MFRPGRRWTFLCDVVISVSGPAHVKAVGCDKTSAGQVSATISTVALITPHIWVSGPQIRECHSANDGQLCNFLGNNSLPTFLANGRYSVIYNKLSMWGGHYPSSSTGRTGRHDASSTTSYYFIPGPVLREKDPVCNLPAISGWDVPGRDMIILSRYLTQLQPKLLSHPSPGWDENNLNFKNSSSVSRLWLDQCLPARGEGSWWSEG